jgi:aspartate aminotransferase
LFRLLEVWLNQSLLLIKIEFGSVKEQTSVHISNRAKSISESKIRMMFELGEEINEDLVRLEVGEPDFITPDNIIQAAFQSAMDGNTSYTSNAGIPELRKAIAEKMLEENGIDVNPLTEVLVTSGAMEALYLALLSVVDIGEELILLSPTYPNYVAMGQMIGADIKIIPLLGDSNFKLDAERITKSINDNTRAIIINSPCNPTGQVYETEAINRVVDSANNHDAFVIADEVYEGLIYDQPSRGIMSIVDYPERILTVNSFSKKYAMTGWRVGWLAGHRTVIEAARKQHQGTTSCAPSISQAAAL